MQKHATARFDIKGWDEQPVEEFDDGRKITRASVKTAWSGDVEGSGAIEYLMMYNPDGQAEFVGLHCVEGRIGEREGSFVLRENGTYSGDGAHGKWSVIDGMGTLEGLSGTGEYLAKKGEHHAEATLKYDLEA